MKNANSSIASLTIHDVTKNSGQLNILCSVELSSGDIFTYQSCNEIEYLDELNDIGGTTADPELRDALGADYIQTLADALSKAATEKYGSLDALLA